MGKDLNEILDNIGMGPYQIVQVLLIGGVLISDGAEILVSTSVLTSLSTQWGLTPVIRGAMMSMIFVGVLCGSLIGGQIGDAFGRRRGVLLAYVGIVTFGLITAAAQGPISMMICRFFFGLSFGTGMGPGVALQVETAPAKWRAHILNLTSLWFMLGEVYTSVLLIMFMPNLEDPDGTKWRWVSILSMIPGILLFPFTYFLLQESPHFLVVNERHVEAVDTVKYIATMNHQTDVVEDLDGTNEDKQLTLPAGNVGMEASLHASVSDGAGGAGEAMLRMGSRRSSRRGSNASASARDIEAFNAQQTSGARLKESLSDQMQVLFSKEMRLILIGGCYLCFLGNFLFYGLTYSLPQIFKELTHSFSPSVEVLIMSLCDGPGVLLAFFLIYQSRFGHRASLALLAGAASILSLSLISIDHGDDWLILGLPSAYLLKYVSSAFFTLLYIYLSEVFPSRVRASGLSLCIAAGRVGSITSPLAAEMLKMPNFKLGEHAPFLLVISGLSLVAILMIKFFLHFERKNQPLQDAFVEDKEEDPVLQKEEIDPNSPAKAG